jgi:hypothetical protein
MDKSKYIDIEPLHLDLINQWHDLRMEIALLENEYKLEMIRLSNLNGEILDTDKVESIGLTKAIYDKYREKDILGNKISRIGCMCSWERQDRYNEEMKVNNQMINHHSALISKARHASISELNDTLEHIDTDKSIVEFELKRRERKEEIEE